MPNDPIEAATRCPKCKRQTRLIERIWNSKSQAYVRIFKCECGELVWDE